MKELKFQQRAVRKLVETTIELLSLSGNRHTLVFKAPTGAGKTVMASQLLHDLTEELRTLGSAPYQEVAFIWIAPNKLHQQSYFKMKNYFTETRLLRAVMYDELDHADGYIKPGEILFVNWESINKDKNVMVRDSEQSSSIYEITRRTQEEHGLPIIVIIDEEHLYWSKTADKSKKVLERILPKVEIRISATPKTQSDYTVTIPREAVVAEEMIKKQVILNPDITKGYNDERELNQHLIERALAKRNQIAEAYNRLGVNINPLLLIQLPNDQSETMSAEDAKIADQVKTYLRAVKGIDAENGKLAVWLSNEKENLAGLERADNLTEVLLFKQAIALGWDYPRAAVLLIFRKLTSNQFTIQTVGRILRMPEQKFYPDELQNYGYVYTDISKDQIEIVAEDMDYLNKDALQALRRENLENVALDSFYNERKSSDRNRLGPDFKQVLIDTFKQQWLLSYQPSLFTLAEMEGEEEETTETAPATGATPQIASATNREKVKNRIRFDVKNINVEIPSDVVFQNEVGVIDVRGEQHKFARSAGEVYRIYLDFCRKLLGKYEKAHSLGVLAGYLMQVMEALFDLFETDAQKVILYHGNKDKFSDIITRALNAYSIRLQARQGAARERDFERYTWEVPSERIYKEETHHVNATVQRHALMPFVELNQASTPEQRFTAFLEKNASCIDWWYKNGDEGKQHYAIPYTNSSGYKALFYVDYIVRMKNGQVFLFDTKSENSDPEAPAKHNAILEYMTAPERADQKLQGGVVIEKNGVWYYSRFPIENTTDLAGWDAFFPNEHK
ncbi:MAG: DEAD/DEAH box helicase family protein [Bacteroidaceae bacterium]|nr:DEAD/DEAH box helicase family protein [Bacteroidaceae bacterium]